MSYMGRLAYNYDSKYLVTANLRADGSSKLAPGHRWGVFPSFSGAWRISSEHRDQLQNKKVAFERMVKTKEFQVWHKLKASMIMKGIFDVQREIDKQMEEKNLKIEFYTPE